MENQWSGGLNVPRPPPNKSLDVSAKQLLFINLRGYFWLVCIRFRPTSTQSLVVYVIMKMMAKSKTRPIGITALSLFFLFGAAMSFISFVSLLFPGSFLEPMWRLNPRAREGFASIGVWAIVLMFAVCVACASAAVGLWRGLWWGYWLAVALLVINLLGDIANVILGIEPRAIVGIPIVVVILAFLMSGWGKRFFAISSDI